MNDLDINIEGDFLVNGHRIRIGVLASDPREGLKAMYDAAGAISAAAISVGETEEAPTEPTATFNPPNTASAPAPRRRGRRTNAEIVAAAIGAPVAAAASLPPSATPLVSVAPPGPPTAPHVQVMPPSPALQQLRASVAQEPAPLPSGIAPAPPPQPTYPPAGPQPYANPNGMWSQPPVVIDRNANWVAWNTAMKQQISIIKQVNGPGAQQVLDNILSAQGGNLDNMTEQQMDIVWKQLSQAFPPQGTPRQFGA